jgi:hypothetical protein
MRKRSLREKNKEFAREVTSSVGSWSASRPSLLHQLITGIRSENQMKTISGYMRAPWEFELRQVVLPDSPPRPGRFCREQVMVKPEACFEFRTQNPEGRP